MLVLGRKQGEEILIGDNIIVKVVEVGYQQIKLGFICPKEISIVRKELIDENRNSKK